MEYRHIIFDLDGTLIDTKEPILKTWQFTLRQYHYEYTMKDLEIVLGITTRKALEKLNIAADEEFEQHWMENYKRFSEQAVFFEGVKEMLQALKQKGRFLGIVTSRCKKEYEDYFSNFNLKEIFDLIVCADDTQRHKPNPDPLYKYVKLAKTELSSCIYIGDMPTDIECANSAGIASGLITWNQSGISCREADFVFRSPEDLLGFLLEK